MDIIRYEGDINPSLYPEGFLDSLKGKTIEEQMKRYRVSGQITFGRTSYGENMTRDQRWSLRKLNKCHEIQALAVKDDIIVGIQIGGTPEKPRILFPYERVCTYYSEDNNGAGYKTRADYLVLVPVPEGYVDESIYYKE